MPKLSDKRKPNRLIAEKSPYLLQYAHNPVEWYPWGDEAISRAKAEDKPIFLSIGYSTCHWCHVQNEESFENEEIAALMNEKFVSIKVDREERPDLDEIYMKALMAMAGNGGWPLSIFLTPDLKPFYGGTYFPPSQRRGMAGFPDVLNMVADMWKNRRDEVIESSTDLMRLVQQQYVTRGKGTLSRDLIDGAYAELVTNLDEQYGGFGVEPKFPLPNSIEFLLRYYARTKKETALRAVKKTLSSIASGGIHDHLGGGFHRYSTDRYWLVPHFEKMLYDNALLAKVYLEAYQVTGEPVFLSTAKDTLEWVLSEMTDKEGGFYSAQDADTADGEGFYYTWTPSEVKEAIGEEAAAEFNDLFGVTQEGNFGGGRSILHLSGHKQGVSPQSISDQGTLPNTTTIAMARLLAVRRQRPRPLVDDKILTSWNGLAISSFAYAYGITRDQRYLKACTESAGFLVSSLVVDGRLFRRYREGDVAIEGTLEDYAFLGAALLDLYEATFDAAWLEEAVHLFEKMIELFWDAKEGGFFMNSSERTIARIKESYDGPTPSGNSVAVMSLLRISELTGRADFREKAEKTMVTFEESMESAPSSHAAMLSALEFWFGSKQIVLTGPVEDSTFGQMLEEIRKRFIPNKVLVLADDGATTLAALSEGKTSLGGKPTAYVCENFTCKRPVTLTTDLIKQLDA